MSADGNSIECVTTIVRGADAIRRMSGELLELRQRVGQAADQQLSPDWFISRTLLWADLPVVITETADRVIRSAVLMRRRSICGMSTGVLKCGDMSGAGGVIAPAGDRAAAVARATSAIFASTTAHTVIASWRQTLADVPPASTDAEEPKRRQVLAVRCRLDLTGGIDPFLQRRTRKFRRNFRYYRRRAEAELGCRFVPDLSRARSIETVGQLCNQGLYAVPTRRAIKQGATIRETPGSFAMALIDRDGQCLSYVAGWRHMDVTCIEWQLNRGGYESSSLSTVMRSFLVEHEAARGVTSVVFVGGTSGIWAQACEFESQAVIQLSPRPGILGREIAVVIARLHPRGLVGRLHRGEPIGDLVA